MPSEVNSRSAGTNKEERSWGGERAITCLIRQQAVETGKAGVAQMRIHNCDLEGTVARLSSQQRSITQVSQCQRPRRGYEKHRSHGLICVKSSESVMTRGDMMSMIPSLQRAMLADENTWPCRDIMVSVDR